jgi:hypothetical protein
MTNSMLNGNTNYFQCIVMVLNLDCGHRKEI